jgi:hypothetical protein
MSEHHASHPTPSGDAFDRSEPQSRFIAIFGGATIVLLVVMVLAIQAYYDHAREQQVYVQVLKPESEDLVNLRSREDSDLHSYKYIDRGAGSVRLPIDRAMELLEKEAAAGRLPYSTKPTPIKVANDPVSAQ